MPEIEEKENKEKMGFKAKQNATGFLACF